GSSATPTTSGGGGASATRQLDIGMTPKSIGPSYWDQVHAGGSCDASKDGHTTIDWTGVTQDTDVTGQINLIQNWITKKVDGIDYAAGDAKALAPITQQALDARVPIVNFDSGTSPQPAGAAIYETDNTASAVKAADSLAKDIGG